jgi:hypothetical protein
MMTAVAAVTALLATAKLAVVSPAATVTETGTVATLIRFPHVSNSWELSWIRNASTGSVNAVISTPLFPPGRQRWILL